MSVDSQFVHKVWNDVELSKMIEAGGKEVTPSGWTPGGKVLNPGPDLVANVWKAWNPKDVYGKK